MLKTVLRIQTKLRAVLSKGRLSPAWTRVEEANCMLVLLHEKASA